MKRKIFILGLPKSGRTTVAKGIEDYVYLNTYDWIKSTFRAARKGESKDLYEENFHDYINLRIKANPNLFIDNYNESMKANSSESNLENIVLDGINNPRDFVTLFNYNDDVVIFLNRNDNDSDVKDYENIAVTVMRDYCFWLSSAFLLPKERWIEINFKMAGEQSDFVKQLGSKNSVYLVKNIEKGIEIINELARKFQ
jgi:hypothetical protein